MFGAIQADNRVLHYDPGMGVAVLAKPYGVTTVDFVKSFGPLFETAASENTPTNNRSKFDGVHPAHRLDGNTSGALVVGLNPTARANLQGAFQKHRVTKQYLALISGAPPQSSGDIDAPLLTEDRQEAGRWFSVTRVDASGKPAHTHYELVATDGKDSLMLLTPTDGRTHQLRVHMASVLKTPIIGDRQYNPEPGDMPMCLHCWNIVMPQHEKSPLHVTAPMPEYMEKRATSMTSMNAHGVFDFH